MIISARHTWTVPIHDGSQRTLTEDWCPPRLDAQRFISWAFGRVTSTSKLSVTPELHEKLRALATENGGAITFGMLMPLRILGIEVTMDDLREIE